MSSEKQESGETVLGEILRNSLNIKHSHSVPSDAMRRREILARQPSYCKILNDLKEVESSESEEQEISGETVEGKAEKGESEVGVERVETEKVMEGQAVEVVEGTDDRIVTEIFSDPDRRHQRAGVPDRDPDQLDGRGQHGGHGPGPVTDSLLGPVLLSSHQRGRGELGVHPGRVLRPADSDSAKQYKRVLGQPGGGGRQEEGGEADEEQGGGQGVQEQEEGVYQVS